MFEIDNQFGIVHAFENLPHRHIVHKRKHIAHLLKTYVIPVAIGTMFLCYCWFNNIQNPG